MYQGCELNAGTMDICRGVLSLVARLHWAGGRKAEADRMVWDEDTRCTATVMGGGRGYVAHRCGRKALPDDPDSLCRGHRLEREGSAETDVDAEKRWRDQKAMERRLWELCRHLKDFYDMAVDLQYDEQDPVHPPTGRLIVDPEDLLRVLRAQDLMPRAS
jgi:hypothetical protein